MKRYTDRETAPLKFHDFYGLMMLIFGIPCAALMSVAGLLLLLDGTPYPFYSISPLVDTVIHTAYLILFLKARKRLDQWQTDGLKLLYGILALTAVRDTLIALTDILSLLELPFRLLFVGLIFIYYRKRAGLFTPDGSPPPVSEPSPADAPAYTFDPVEEPAPEEPQPAPQMRFCRHCGARLAEGARFCAACGRPVEE